MCSARNERLIYVRYCSANGCLSNSRNNPDINFFRITKCPVKSKLWLKNIDREDLLTSYTKIDSYSICDKHFPKKYISYGKHKVRLDRRAVPTLDRSPTVISSEHAKLDVSLDEASNSSQLENPTLNQNPQTILQSTRLTPKNITDHQITVPSPSTVTLEYPELITPKSEDPLELPITEITSADRTTTFDELPTPNNNFASSGAAFTNDSVCKVNDKPIGTATNSIDTFIEVSIPSRPYIISTSIEPCNQSVPNQKGQFKQSGKQVKSGNVASENDSNNSTFASFSTVPSADCKQNVTRAVSSVDSDESDNNPGTLRDSVVASTSISPSVISNRKRLLNEHELEEPKRRKQTKNDHSDDSINTFFKLCDKHLDEKMADFIKIRSQFRKKIEDCNNVDIFILCTHLFYSSPLAYNVLQNFLNLAPIRSLQHFCVPRKTEIAENVIQILKYKVADMTTKQKHCAVCVNSVSVKKNLYYDVKTDLVIGFHAFHGVQKPKPATNAYIIMVQGLFDEYVQPITYAFTAENKTDDNLKLLVDKTISVLIAIGFNVNVLVSDCESRLRHRCVTPEEPFFFVDGRKIYHIIDSSHLMKLVRNKFMKYDFHFEGSVAKWQHVLQCYEFDQQRDLKFAPRLTDAHTTPNSFQKANVKYAVETLSLSVATALATYAELGWLEQSAVDTANFVRKMSNLFNILNSSTQPTRDNKKCFTGKPSQTEFLNEMISFVDNLKIINPKNGFKVKSSISKSFKISIRSVLMLQEDLKSEKMTRRLNLDCVENFIEKYRLRNCTQPTCKQLLSAYRKYYVHNILKPLNKGNKTNDCNKLILKVKDFIKSEKSESRVEDTANKNILPKISDSKPETRDQYTQTLSLLKTYLSKHSNEEKISLKISDFKQLHNMAEHSVYSYASCILRKCLERHSNCEVLKTYLSQRETRRDTYNYFKFLFNDNKDKDIANVLEPWDAFVEFAYKMETVFRAYFRREYLNGETVNSLIISFDHSYPNIVFPCPCFPERFSKVFYFSLRTYHSLMFNNREFKVSKNNRKRFVVSK